ncbi:MAG: M20/M25/M40 family metallo-hydrolase, partial [Erysipelotrichaceae bacterium]|nr:M20/M25/M40 family metallo-hydrolase [Erysipelotrichaceae bacterium]
VLIRLDGSDPALKPALFMAHQDVVPVIAGTENDWVHPPFSGDISDGYIWGRGALDIKCMLIGELEAMEYQLQQGKSLRRTVYLAFGQDEEVIGSGAIAIANYLQSKGVQLEFLLDEGGGIYPGKAYGANDIQVGTIGMYEKGYADLQLTARSFGGHSSNPFRGTSLGHLAQSIAAIVNNPLENVLPECAKQTLKILAPHISEEPLHTLVQDIEGNEDKIIDYYVSNPELNNQVHTTIAPTMITPGSPAGNVMPQAMSAVINFRVAPQDTIESILDHCRALASEGVQMDYIVANEASRQSRADSFGFDSLTEVLGHYFRNVVFVPGVNIASTDARSYEEICDCCLRFGPFLEDSEVRTRGVHGTNEKISIRTYLQGIRVLISLMDKTC